jgi:hypothetical protein
LNSDISQFSYSVPPFARRADTDQHLSIPAVLSGALTQLAPFQVSRNTMLYNIIQYYTILRAAMPLTSFDMRRIATLASMVSSLINHVKQLLAARPCKATLSTCQDARPIDLKMCQNKHPVSIWCCNDDAKPCL